MLKSLIFSILFLVGAFEVPAMAQANGEPYVVDTCGAQTYRVGSYAYQTINKDGNLCTGATVTLSGTQDENLKQVNGATVNVGVGAASTGTQRVTTSTDSTIGTLTTVTNPLPQQLGITPTDRTITSATGSSQTVMSANAARHSLTVENTGNANCGLNPTGGTAVIGGAGTLTLFPGGSYQPRIPTLSAVTAICTSGQQLYAEEN